MFKRLGSLVGLALIGVSMAGCVVAPAHHRPYPGYYDGRHDRDDRHDHGYYDGRHDDGRRDGRHW